MPPDLFQGSNYTMAEHRSHSQARSGVLASGLRFVLEFLLSILILATPWLFGSVEPLMEFGILAIIGLMLITWSVLLLVEGRFSWRGGPMTYAMGVLFVLTMVQLVPLPHLLLRLISPGTASHYDRLIPAQPEQIEGSADEFDLPSTTKPGSTLSLYPTATRQFLLQVLAIWMLFLVTRHELADLIRLRRLSLLVMLNGAALALFGIVQSYSSAPNLVYWRFVTSGEVFGPFINRNHFATYVNMSLCLGLGLVLCRSKPKQTIDYRRQRSNRAYATPPKQEWLLKDPPFVNTARLRDELDGLLEPLYEMLQTPSTLWILFPLSLMAAGVVMSASRGGLASLLLAIALGLSLQAFVTRFGRQVAIGLILVAIFLGAVTWVGLDRLEARLRAGGPGEGANAASRLGMWASGWQVFTAFPVLGIGGGVYEYFDELQRQEADSPGVIVLHAHNELVEALVEGGLLRGIWTVAFVILALRASFRALRRYRDEPSVGLITGLMMAFLTLLLHSLVEFSIHVPAVAVLAAVVLAHLEAHGAVDAAPTVWGGWIPAAAAVALTTIGLVLAAEGWRHHQVMRHRAVAARCLDEAATTTGDLRQAWLQRRLHILRAVLPIAPEHAMLRLEMDDAHQKLLEHEHQIIDNLAGFMHATEHLLLGMQPFSIPLPMAYQRLLFGAFPELYAHKRAAHRNHFGPMVNHVRRARDACPVQFRAQLRLATLAAQSPAGTMDAATNYLERAKELAPFRQDLWFQLGLNYWAQWQAARAGRKPDEGALRAKMAESWRRCLEMSDRSLEEVLVRCLPTLPPELLANEVLPANPRILFAAAQFIAKSDKDLAKRLPLLSRLQSTVRTRLDANLASADDVYLLGLALWDLGQPQQAKNWLDQALAQDENLVECRYHRARWNVEHGNYTEARRDLDLMLRRRPDFAPGRDLSNLVDQRLRELRRP